MKPPKIKKKITRRAKMMGNNDLTVRMILDKPFQEKTFVIHFDEHHIMGDIF